MDSENIPAAPPQEAAEPHADEMTPAANEAPTAAPTRFDELAIVYLPIDEIREYENNPRKNDAAVEKVVNSIKLHGMSAPISVDGDKVIIYGHTRYRACRRLNMARVPCIVRTDLPPELVRSLRLADNKIAEASGWDNEKLLRELEQLDLDGIDMEQFGFIEGMSDDEIDSFFDGVETKAKEPRKQTVTCPKCGETFEVEVE